ncbi:hypothetical protein [Deinococcus phoenicis]|uniref:hypothetical protein n=1 Tax=Deinococcus phoenicis TaxID=1476583 RepID=UPI0004B1333A|nr:hypothetical protein [Deinococcus phoenicis]
MLAASALADGGGSRLSPRGIADSDAVTRHCRSRHRILFFALNTQAVRRLYRGQVSRLNFRSDAHYVGLPGLPNWDVPWPGTGLE